MLLSSTSLNGTGISRHLSSSSTSSNISPSSTEFPSLIQSASAVASSTTAPESRDFSLDSALESANVSHAEARSFLATDLEISARATTETVTKAVYAHYMVQNLPFPKTTTSVRLMLTLL